MPKSDLRRALLTNEFMPSMGGVERLLYLRAREFEAEALTVFAPRVAGGEAFDAGQPYVTRRASVTGSRIPIWAGIVRSLAPAWQLYREHRRRQFDVIECGQCFPCALIAAVLQRLTGTPYLVWVHGNDLLGPARFRLSRVALRAALRRARGVVANSTYTARLIADFGVPAASIRVIEPVVDLDAFRRNAPSASLRQRYGLGDGPLLLTVCRLVARKGVDQVIAAVAQLAASHPSVHYLIVGKGPEQAALQALADRLGVSERVIFAGPVPDDELTAHYDLASIFVMPSRFLGAEASVEGLGLVYLEAMANGLPVVAGRSGGVPDIVHHDENGLLVDPGSLPELVHALDSLLSDPNRAAHLGEAGMAFVRRPRSWQALTVATGCSG